MLSCPGYSRHGSCQASAVPSVRIAAAAQVSILSFPPIGKLWRESRNRATRRAVARPAVRPTSTTRRRQRNVHFTSTPHSAQQIKRFRQRELLPDECRGETAPANLTARLHSAQHPKYRARAAPTSHAPRYRGTRCPNVAGLACEAFDVLGRLALAMAQERPSAGA